MSYEFNELENRVFNKAGFWMLLVGVLVGLSAIQSVMAAIEGGINQQVLMEGGLRVVVAGFLLRAGHAFRRIPRSEGNDIDHTMAALSALRGYFFIQAAAVILLIALIVYQVLVQTGTL